jgi:hypothetical protein
MLKMKHVMSAQAPPGAAELIQARQDHEFANEQTLRSLLQADIEATRQQIMAEGIYGPY